MTNPDILEHYAREVLNEAVRSGLIRSYRKVVESMTQDDLAGIMSKLDDMVREADMERESKEQAEKEAAEYRKMPEYDDHEEA